MIQFNELRVTPNDKSLIIDVSIKDDPNYSLVYLNQIRIDTHETYSGLGPSLEPVYSYEIHSNDDLKILRLNIKKEDLQILGNLLFIYVTAKGLPLDNQFEDGDKSHSLMTIADLEPIYKSIIKLISNQEEHCKDNSALVDHILKINALDIALKTCNYPIAIKYWKKYFTKERLDYLTIKCDLK